MQQLLAQIAELKARLAEAEDTLEAIRSGAVDALVVEGENGLKVFTLKGADQTYRILVETMNEGAVTISASGIILFANQHFADLVHLPIHKILGLPFKDFLPRSEETTFTQFLKQIRESAKRVEMHLINAKDEKIVAQISGSRLDTEDIRGYCLVVTDVTRRKEAEAALREMSQRVIRAQEQERRRVARELHDGVNQILSATKFSIHSLEREVPTSRQLEVKINRAKELIDKAIGEVRAISHNLHPSELDDLGLPAAIRSLIHDFQERTGTDVRFAISRQLKKLSPESRAALYRIVQEALTNVERHSAASRIEVDLRQEDRNICLSIRDNGKGFPTEPKRGLGIENMRERARIGNGSFEIKSVPKQGTEIRVRIPI